jgi:hypothetical protein
VSGDEEDGLDYVESMLRQDPDDARLIRLARLMLGDVALRALAFEDDEIEGMRRRGLLLAAASGTADDPATDPEAVAEVVDELVEVGLLDAVQPLFQEIAQAASAAGHLYVAGVGAALTDDPGAAVHAVAQAILALDDDG